VKVKKEKKKWTPPFAVLEGALRAVVDKSEPGASLGSEVAIAKEHGVSRMTARKAVNALVAEGLVERRAGVGLFVRGKGTVTRRFRLVAGNLLWDVAMAVASGARGEACERGVEIEFRDAGGDMASFVREIKALPGSGVAGGIILSSHDEVFEAALRKVAATGFPLAVVDRVPRGDGIPSVASDNRAGGATAADALADAGRADLAFVGDLAADTVAERWEGFRARCAERGLAAPVSMDIRGIDRFGSWEAAVRKIVGRLLARRRRPTGLFCSCDAVARFAMRTLAAQGLSVPRDLSIVGFDDDPIAEWTTPALTTVAQDFAALGREGVRALIARLADPSGAARATIVPVRLVRRASVAVLG